jgi:hypothetical protein
MASDSTVSYLMILEFSVFFEAFPVKFAYLQGG